MNDQETGRVISFDRVKRTGWIRVAGYPGRIFFHYRQVVDQEYGETVVEGDQVRFRMDQTDHGFQALDIYRLRT